MNTDSVERHAHVSDLRPPWGADACIKSASAEAHAEFAHRLPDAVNKAGTGRALRVMRIARTAQKNPLNVGIQNQFDPVCNSTPYIVLVKHGDWRKYPFHTSCRASDTREKRVYGDIRESATADARRFDSGCPQKYKLVDFDHFTIRAGEKLPEKKSRG